MVVVVVCVCYTKATLERKRLNVVVGEVGGGGGTDNV